MDASMFSGLFGAMTCEHRLAVVANNLANVNTTGFKQERMNFQDTMTMFAHDKIMEPVVSLRDKPLLPDPRHLSRVRIAETRTDFSQGSLQVTGQPLDMAITGKGFFKVRTEEGDRYTRNGNFKLSAAGTIVTAQGFPVLAGGAELAVPQGAKIEVDGAGRIFADRAQIGALDVVGIDDEKKLVKSGNNNFKPKDGAAVGETALAPNDFRVEQGYLEVANVGVVEEMVNMIELQRAFEAYQKVISQSSETDQKAIRMGSLR